MAPATCDVLWMDSMLLVGWCKGFGGNRLHSLLFVLQSVGCCCCCCCLLLFVAVVVFCCCCCCCCCARFAVHAQSFLFRRLLFLRLILLVPNSIPLFLIVWVSGCQLPCRVPSYFRKRIDCWLSPEVPCRVNCHAELLP